MSYHDYSHQPSPPSLLLGYLGEHFRQQFRLVILLLISQLPLYVRSFNQNLCVALFFQVLFFV